MWVGSEAALLLQAGASCAQKEQCMKRVSSLVEVDGGAHRYARERTLRATI
jgi:hypothetical protein